MNKHRRLRVPDLIDLLIEDPRWNDYDLMTLSSQAGKLALNVASIAPGDYEISLLACNDDRIGALNAEFRGKPTPTNVLSWPAINLFADAPGEAPSHQIAAEQFGPTSLGDIAISYETIMKETDAAGRNPNDHITHLILHGVLHLLGYDHENDADAALMEELEVRGLASLGIATPY